jgi:hypothetical protein
MPDVYFDTYHDLYGTFSVQPGGIFSLDGTNAPRLIVEVAWGGSATVDPAQGFLAFDTGRFDTDMFGTVGWVDIAGDVNSITIHRGNAGEAETAIPSTWTVVLDNAPGDYDPTNPAGRYYGQIDVGEPIWIKGEWGGNAYGRVRGFVDKILPNIGADLSTVTLECSDALASLGRAKLLTATSQGAGETTGARINRILDAVGWPSTQRIIGTGLSTCQATTLGDQALTLIQKAVGTELGSLYTGRNGEVIFRDRLYPYTSQRTQQVRALLTDTGIDVDMVSLEVGMSRDAIWNQASVTRDDGVEQVVTDQASADKYGLQTYPSTVGTWLPSDLDAASIASWLVGQGKKSRLEVTAVTVQAATLGLWDALLQLDLLDRLRIVRDYGPWTVDAQVLIGSYDESISKDAWDFAFSTRATDAYQPFIFNTSKFDTGTFA